MIRSSFVSPCARARVLRPRRFPPLGPGLQDLDLDSVHVCADTEVSWPIQDWTRCCVSLEELVRFLTHSHGRRASLSGKTCVFPSCSARVLLKTGHNGPRGAPVNDSGDTLRPGGGGIQ